MAKRKALSKKLRFEVFKRDSFKCQYCGRSAPDIILEVDHIRSVKDGGKNELINLITSCIECNRGKGANKLSDNSVVEKQRKQLEELNERRTQLKMMMEWRDELLKLEDEKVNYIKETFESMASCTVTDIGIKELQKLVKKYPMNIIMDSIEASTSQYLVGDGKNGYTLKSRNKAFDYIEKICVCKLRVEQNPDIADLYYICGILRKRLNYFDKKVAFAMLKRAYDMGSDISELKFIASKVNNWYEFEGKMESITGN